MSNQSAIARLAELARGSAPDEARENLIDQVGQDFWAIEQQLDPGILVLLESLNVPIDKQRVVTRYLADVVKGLLDVEREVSKLCRVPDATKAGYKGLDERGKLRDAGLER